MDQSPEPRRVVRFDLLSTAVRWVAGYRRDDGNKGQSAVLSLVQLRLLTTVAMTRHRHSSYSSSTLSSTSSSSSSSSSTGYASIQSISSWPSRISLQIRSSEFWNQFDRKSRNRKSVSSVLKNIFSAKQREVSSSRVTDVFQLEDRVQPPASSSSSSSVISRLSPSNTLPHGPPAASPSPAGLYCVIEEFLTEYDTRILEQEERAELLARRARQIS